MGRDGIMPSHRIGIDTISSLSWLYKKFGAAAFCTIWALLFAFVGTDLAAQTATGTITGTVSDKSGALVPGATIRVRNEATNAHQQAVSSDDGLYRVPVLPPGTYEVRAEMPGFKALVNSGVLLSVGENRTVNLALEVGEISDSITVTDLASQIDTQDSQLSSLVDSRRIERLPLNGRNVFVLATFQPGVVPAMSSIANAGGPNSESFMSSGTRHRGNNFTLDGQSNNHDGLSGLARVILNVDTVQEFRLIRNHFSAEYGTHSGTVVSVVSKSGTNSVHGTLYGYHRNAALDAAEIFAPFNPVTRQKDKAPLIQNTFGVTVGGPVLQDRLFFFGSYEGFRERTGEPGRFVVETPQFRKWVIQNNPNSFASPLFKEFAAPAPTRDILTVADLPPDQVSFINPVHPPPRICRCWEESMPSPRFLLIVASSACVWTVTLTKRKITSSDATTSQMKEVLTTPFEGHSETISTLAIRPYWRRGREVLIRI